MTIWRRFPLPAVLTTVLLLALPVASFGWGGTGHRTIGRIAERYLTPEAAAAVERLLGPDSLAEVGTWADWIRSDPAWDHAAAWHYVNIEDDETYETAQKNPAGDILEALGRFEAVLRDPAADAETQAEALRWLVHLVGDLHQPLHVGRRRDRGGNGVTVVFFGEPTNLHSVWDSGLIDREKLSFSEWAEFLLPVSEEEVERLQATSPLDWAMESKALREAVYDIGTGGLSWDYRYRSLPIVERRLREAGVRLAGLLNSVFAAQEMPPPAVTPGPGDSP